jgi:HD-like signal output (HDOD) protein
MSTMATASEPPVKKRLGAVPVMPPGVLYLMGELAREDSGLRDLVILLERFPTIAARVIGVSNSAWSASPQVISTLDAACRRLGFQVVRAIAVGLAVSNAFDPTRCPTFNPVRQWTRSMLAAEVAGYLARLVEAKWQEQVEPARMAALMHNIGLLALSHCLPKETDAALRETVDGADASTSLSASLLAHTGFTVSEAGAQASRDWDLPAMHCAMFEHIEDADYSGEHWLVVQIVGQARALCSVRSAEWQPELYRPLLARAGISAEAVESCHATIAPMRELIGAMASDLFRG